MKIKTLAIIPLAALTYSISLPAFANPHAGSFNPTTEVTASAPLGTPLNSNPLITRHIDKTLYGSSSTASFFYKRAVKKFESGSLDKAEKAFRASLRANGSKTMDRMSLHFLTIINHRQGEAQSAKDYAQAYFELNKK